MPVLLKVSTRTDNIREATTFGFEAEWQNGAESLNALLYTSGLARTDHLHNWHCSCNSCDPWAAGTFYGQTDSSCAGEIISGVHAFRANGKARSADKIFESLTDAAFSVGAEAGMSAGFHVHVGSDHLGAMERAQTLAAFTLWEGALDIVARGKFDKNRGYNATNLDGEVGSAVIMQWEALRPAENHLGSRRQMLELLLDTMTAAERGKFYSSIEHYRTEGYSDRHSALNTRTSRPTWEFRLWNSTRSPWRMELYTRLSIALMDPAITRWMVAQPAMTTPAAIEIGFERLALRLVANGHAEAGELALRQQQYQATLAV